MRNGWAGCHDGEHDRSTDKGGVAMKSICAIARSARAAVVAVLVTAVLLSAPALAQDEDLFCWPRHSGEKICAI
jgi:hypothetical protein